MNSWNPIKKKKNAVQRQLNGPKKKKKEIKAMCSS